MTLFIQERNAMMAEYRGYGLSINKLKLSKEILVEKLRELIENPKYRKNAKDLSKMLKEKPHSAEELLIKNTEYATKFDVHERLDFYGRHLR